MTRSAPSRSAKTWSSGSINGSASYCCDSKSSEEVKARYPLAEAKVEVKEVEGNPGYYTSKFFLRPHYQLEGLTVSLRLVSKLPSAKGDDGGR